MIIEVLSYLWHANSCPQYLKKLGLLQELISIESRANRLKSAWQEHLKNSKKLIIETARKSRTDTVIILGAGLLNDVPLEFLRGYFQEVILVDIFFLTKTKKECKKYSNVSLIELDITQSLEATLQSIKSSKEDRSSPVPTARPIILTHNKLNPEHTSLVISLNLCSQLAIPIKNYIEKKNINLNLNSYYKSLIKNHIELIKSYKTKGSEILIITDTQRKLYNKTHGLISSENSLEDLDLEKDFYLKKIAGWNWSLAPLGELDKNYEIQLEVSGFQG